MSRAASPFTEQRYGVARVTREWEMARSSFYFRRAVAAQPGRVLQRRGPKSAWSDAALLEKIRQVIAASPFKESGDRRDVFQQSARKHFCPKLQVRVAITSSCPLFPYP